MLSARSAEPPPRIPMSFEEYLGLGEAVRGEYDGGALVLAPRPTADHAEITYRIAERLRTIVRPPLRVGIEVDWPGSRSDGRPEVTTPDVAVYTYTGEQTITATPALVVEVLTPSDRAEDLERKRDLYARRGLADYWVVDQLEHQVTVFAFDACVLVEVRRVGSGSSLFTFGAHQVTIDVDRLLDMRL